MRCTIKDIEKVDRVMNDPSILENILDDYSPEEYSLGAALNIDTIYILMPNDFSVIAAIPMNNTTYQIHVNIIKKHRGVEANKGVIKAVNYLFNKTRINKLVAFIPECFPNVKAYSDLMGLKQEGLLSGSIKRNGKFYDQYIMSINKSTWGECESHREKLWD